jgi:hypothetical protein
VEARQEAVDRFQSDPGTRLIICSLRTAGVGITLTEAQTALFLELDWTPATMEQAEDRIHRIGQRGSVLIVRLVARDSIDDYLLRMLESKSRISSLGSAEIIKSTALYGYKKDGTPRLQLPGPGRPQIDPVERKQRKKAAKQSWRERNLDRQREYTRKWRAKSD